MIYLVIPLSSNKAETVAVSPSPGAKQMPKAVWIGAGGLGCLLYPTWFVPACQGEPASAGEH